MYVLVVDRAVAVRRRRSQQAARAQLLGQYAEAGFLLQPDTQHERQRCPLGDLTRHLIEESLPTRTFGSKTLGCGLRGEARARNGIGPERELAQQDASFAIENFDRLYVVDPVDLECGQSLVSTFHSKAQETGDRDEGAIRADRGDGRLPELDLHNIHLSLVLVSARAWVAARIRRRAAADLATAARATAGRRRTRLTHKEDEKEGTDKERRCASEP